MQLVGGLTGALSFYSHLSYKRATSFLLPGMSAKFEVGSRPRSKGCPLVCPFFFLPQA